MDCNSVYLFYSSKFFILINLFVFNTALIFKLIHLAIIFML